MTGEFDITNASAAAVMREIERVRTQQQELETYKRGLMDRLELLSPFISESEKATRKKIEADIARSGSRIITTQKREGKTRESAREAAIEGASALAKKKGSSSIPDRSMRLIELALERHYPTKKKLTPLHSS